MTSSQPFSSAVNTVPGTGPPPRAFKPGVKPPLPISNVEHAKMRMFKRSALPADVPAVFDYITPLPSVPLGLNGDLGDCGVESFLHILASMTFAATGKEATFTDAIRLKLYETLGGYVPGRPSTDQGIYLADGAEYYVHTGVPMDDGTVEKAVGYCRIDWTQPDQVAAAMYYLGNVWLGVDLPTYALNSTVWDQTAPPASLAGGHAVMAAARVARGNLLGTSWTMKQSMTPGFVKGAPGEAFAFFSKRWYNPKTGLDKNGHTYEQGKAVFLALGGTVVNDQPVPVPAPPMPPPAPKPPTPPAPPQPSPPSPSPTPTPPQPVTPPLPIVDPVFAAVDKQFVVLGSHYQAGLAAFAAGNPGAAKVQMVLMAEAAGQMLLAAAER